MSWIRLISFILILFPSSVWGVELYDVNRTSVRALGMGNAYTTLVNNADSLFYNPAGLGKFGGVNWTIFDISAGSVGLDALEQLADLQDEESFAETLEDLYGENVWLAAHGKTAIAFPFVTAALYTTYDASFHVDDPSMPELSLNYVNDVGAAVGIGATIIPGMQIGTVLKRINRTGTRTTYGGATLGTLDPETIKDDISKSGLGYSADLGINLAVPGPISPAFAFVWRNIGTTKFRPDETGAEAPPSDESEMIVGASMGINTGLVSVTPIMDFRYLNRSDVQISKKINFGIELELPLLSLRGGYHQGYYTLGAGFNLGLINVEAATYGVELGEYAGQKEDRRYMIQLSLDLGFDLGIGTSGGSSGSSTGRSRANNVFGGRRLKQRR